MTNETAGGFMNPATPPSGYEPGSKPAPSLAKLFLPLLALVALGVIGLIWGGMRSLSDVQRTMVGNAFPYTLDAPGSYTGILPGPIDLVSFDLTRDQITITDLDGNPVQVSPGLKELTLTQSQGNSTYSTTISGDKLSRAERTGAGPQTITLTGDGQVFSDDFELVEGAVLTGGSRFDEVSLGDAFGKNGALLGVSGLAAVGGAIGALLAWRAKRRHQSAMAFEIREAKRAARRG